MRRAVIAAGWLWLLAALPQVTDASTDLLWGLVLFFCGLAIGLAWITYSAAVPGVFRVPRVRWYWVSVPVVGIGGVLLASTNRDLAVRVWLCDSGLREYAERVRRNPEAAEHREPKLVGLFWVRSASSDGRQVRLDTAYGFLSIAGLVYQPDGELPELHHASGRLYGPWWWFWDDF